MKGKSYNAKQQQGRGSWNDCTRNQKHGSSASDSSGDLLPTELLQSQDTCGEGDRDTIQHLEPFQATSYLERKVEKLGLDNEHEAMNLVADELQEKHKRAERKREDHMKHIVDSNAEKIKKVESVQVAVKDREKKKRSSILNKHIQKLETAQMRRLSSLDSITMERKRYHRKVQRQKSDSIDSSLTVSAESLNSLECRLSMADRRREKAIEARKHRSQGCRGWEGKAQFGANESTSIMGLCDNITNGGRDDAYLSYQIFDDKEIDSNDENPSSKGIGGVLSRLRTKDKKKRPNTRAKRLWGARVIQEWWRCMIDGVQDEGTVDTQFGAETSLSLSIPGCSTLSSVDTNVSLKTLPPLLFTGMEDDNSSKEAPSAEFEDPRQTCLIPSLEGQQTISYNSEDAAARKIQRFFCRYYHDIKMINRLVQNSSSIQYLCAKIREIETASFDEGVKIIKDPDLIMHVEKTLRALRMGKRIKCVPPAARSARAFMCSILINSFPTSSLDDDGALSSGSSTNNVLLELKKEKVVESSGEVVLALLILEEAVNEAVKIKNDDDNTRAVGGGMNTYAGRILAASKKVTIARLFFCKRFDEWKRLDGIRLAEEMTSACIDVLLMQLRAERDLHIAAASLGLEDAMMDDESLVDEPSLNVGFRQIKEGTQRQLGYMFAALVSLVGREKARLRMIQAAEAAFRRLQQDDIESDADADDSLLTSQIYRGESGSTSSMSVGNKFYETEADSSTKGGDEKEGAGHALTAGDLLSNEWLVHEVLLSKQVVTVTLEQAEESSLLDFTKSLKIDDAFWKEVAEDFNAHNYDPLIMLLSDLRAKIIAITPKRKDLAIETCEAMDIDLLKQMNMYGALDVKTFFKVIRFAGERMLELEAPIRNKVTSAKLDALSEAQSGIALGTTTFDIEFIKEYFMFLFNKLGEIHLDILNAHLQFIMPFLRQHGVEYEKDRFIERLDSNELNLDVTYDWLQKAICSLREESVQLPEERNDSSRLKAAEDAKKLLDELEAQTGDAYLKLVRIAMVDHLLKPMITFKVLPPVNEGGTMGHYDDKSHGNVVLSSSTTGSNSSKYKHSRIRRKRDEECYLSGVSLPETFHLDKDRLIHVAMGIEQVAHTSTLLAFIRHLLAIFKIGMKKEEDETICRDLMILLKTEDVTSMDVVAQVVEWARKMASSRCISPQPAHLSFLANQATNVLESCNCPVYKLWLKRVLSVTRIILTSTDMDEPGFEALLRDHNLLRFKEFMMDTVINPLVVVERHNEAVFFPFYNEVLPLALQTSEIYDVSLHQSTMGVD